MFDGGLRCGAETVVPSAKGVGICDYPCAGNDAQICGGYWAFTAYVVGEQHMKNVSASGNENNQRVWTLGTRGGVILGGKMIFILEVCETEGGENKFFSTDNAAVFGARTRVCVGEGVSRVLSNITTS